MGADVETRVDSRCVTLHVAHPVMIVLIHALYIFLENPLELPSSSIHRLKIAGEDRSASSCRPFDSCPHVVYPITPSLNTIARVSASAVSTKPCSVSLDHFIQPAATVAAHGR